MNLVALSLVVFALTLVITKSEILASKREFVEKRFTLTRATNGSVNPIHRWWHAIWTCPMCCGFWVAVPVCYVWPVHGMPVDVSVAFGANWLLHCLEAVLVFGSDVLSDLRQETESRWSTNDR